MAYHARVFINQQQNNMKPLPTEFNKNGMKYKIIDRSETRYLAGVYSLESGRLGCYETGRINKNKEREMFGSKIEASESIVGNEAFGSDKWEGCMSPKSKHIVEGWFKEGTKSDIHKAKTALASTEKDKSDT